MNHNWLVHGYRSVAVAVALVGGAATGLVISTSADSPSPPANRDVIVPSYPKNEFGETYGSSALADSPEQEPDLIAAIGTRGEDGFVRKEDLNLPNPSSPEEAIKRQSAAELKGGRRVIPLYAIDGKTVLGDFVVGF